MRSDLPLTNSIKPGLLDYGSGPDAAAGQCRRTTAPRATGKGDVDGHRTPSAESHPLGSDGRSERDRRPIPRSPLADRSSRPRNREGMGNHNVGWRGRG